jgi:hypothetical protein
MGAVIFMPQFPKVGLHPFSGMERVTPGRKKISSVSVLLPYRCIISFQKIKHGVMQHDVMLGMTF